MLEVTDLVIPIGRRDRLKVAGFEVQPESRLGVCGMAEPVDALRLVLTGALTPVSGAVNRGRCGYMPRLEFVAFGETTGDFLRTMAALQGLHRLKAAARINRVRDLCGLQGQGLPPSAPFSRRRLYNQKLNLAQALMPDPEVLLVHEPFAGLDPDGRDQLRHLLVRAASGRSMLLFTNETPGLRDMVDEIMVLSLQGVVARDAPADLLADSPWRNYIRVDFPLMTREQKQEIFTALPALRQRVTERNGSWFLPGDLRKQEAGILAEYCSARGIDIRLTEGRGDLDTVIHSLSLDDLPLPPDAPVMNPGVSS